MFHKSTSECLSFQVKHNIYQHNIKYNINIAKKRYDIMELKNIKRKLFIYTPHLYHHTNTPTQVQIFPVHDRWENKGFLTILSFEK